ncbi:hypothetical protein ACJJTC_004266 [Scirpophaga incertulas]
MKLLLKEQFLQDTPLIHVSLAKLNLYAVERRIQNYTNEVQILPLCLLMSFANLIYEENVYWATTFYKLKVLPELWRIMNMPGHTIIEKESCHTAAFIRPSTTYSGHLPGAANSGTFP